MANYSIDEFCPIFKVHSKIDVFNVDNLTALTGITVGSNGTPILGIQVFTVTLTPSSVAATTTAEQTFTVNGLLTNHKVIVNGPTPTAGTGIVNARVSAANTLALTFINTTAAAATPAAGTYIIIAIAS